MNIYLDDNLAGQPLAGLLRRAGHRVTLPLMVGMSGATDPRHLLYALQHGLPLLTADPSDFEDLHTLVTLSGGSHGGILLVYSDNDPKRDMKPGEIVKAIAKLEASGLPLANELYVVNHWR